MAENANKYANEPKTTFKVVSISPFWYWPFVQVVLNKGLLNECCCCYFTCKHTEIKKWNKTNIWNNAGTISRRRHCLAVSRDHTKFRGSPWTIQNLNLFQFYLTPHIDWCHLKILSFAIPWQELCYFTVKLYAPFNIK